jgi:hypothetical protein
LLSNFRDNTVEFPTKPSLILSIDCYDDTSTPPKTNGIAIPINVYKTNQVPIVRISSGVAYNFATITYIDDTHIKLSTNTGFPEFNLNVLDMVYNVCYI